jgi:hypothetical protein
MRRSGSGTVTTASTSTELHMAATLPCLLLIDASSKPAWIVVGAFGESLLHRRLAPEGPSLRTELGRRSR